VAPFRGLHRKIFARDPEGRTERYARFEAGLRSRAHLYVRDCFETRSGEVKVALRAERAGFLRGAALASILIFVVLAAYVVFADSIVDQASSAGAALLLAPSLLTALIVRPGEHSLARVLHSQARSLLVVDGLLTFLAAAALVVVAPVSNQAAANPDAPAELRLIWAALAAVALAILAILVVSWRRPKGEEEDPVP